MDRLTVVHARAGDPAPVLHRRADDRLAHVTLRSQDVDDGITDGYHVVQAKEDVIYHVMTVVGVGVVQHARWDPGESAGEDDSPRDYPELLVFGGERALGVAAHLARADVPPHSTVENGDEGGYQSET